MFAIALGDDGAELRPLEPWHAAGLLAHTDRGREFIGRHVGLPDVVTDLKSSRAYLQSYAEKAAADTGRIYGIWTDGMLVGGALFRTMDVERGNTEAGCWLEHRRGPATRDDEGRRAAGELLVPRSAARPGDLVGPRTGVA